MSELHPIQITVDEKMILAVPQCKEMDELHTQEMLEKTLAASRQTPAVPLVLDMSGVAFVPSLSLGALVTLLKTCKENQKRFLLTGLQPIVRQVMTACRLDRLFEIYDSLEDARFRLGN